MNSFFYKKIFSLIFSFVALSFSAFSQTSTIDSLKNIINTHRQHDTIRVNTLITISNILYSYSYEQATKYSQEARDISIEINYPLGESESTRLLGICEFFKSNYPQALEYIFKALNIAQKAGLKKQTAKCYNNIGLIYWKQKNYEEAIDYTQKALEIDKEFNNDVEIAWCFNNLGSMKFAQKKYTKAINYFTKTLDASRRINYLLVQNKSYKNLAIIYIEKQNFDKAKQNLDSALKICNITNNQLDLCQTFEYYGKLYSK